jgi:hypothetical protein
VELDVVEMDAELAIKELKKYKAPGQDGLPAELFKDGCNILNKYLISEIWTKEEMPVDWKVGLIYPIYKKGDPLEYKNYRVVTLANVGYKFFSKVLFKKLDPIVRENVRKYQCGFIAGKSITYQIFNLRQIMEKSSEYGVKIYYLFTDFKAAYDSINRKSLYLTMRDVGIPAKLIFSILPPYSVSRYRIGSQS